MMNVSAFHKQIGKGGRDQEPKAIRLQRLSYEVGRIASTLASLSVDSYGPAPAGENDGVPAIALETVQQVIRARRLRARYFDADLFADPAWDMLLDLLLVELSQQRVSITSLCAAAAVPPTTALRWIHSMVDAGLFNRRPDPCDGRRIFIELSSSASSSLRRYFQAVGNVVVI